MDMDNKNSNNLIVDLNFLQLSKYFFSQRYFIFIFVFAIPAIVGLWLFFFNKPIYTSSVKLTVDMNTNSIAIDDRMSYFFSQEQQAISKISQIEDFINSKLFQLQLEKFFKNPSDVIKKYPKVEKSLKATNFYFRNYTPVGIKVNSKYKAVIIAGKIGFASDIEKRSMNLSVDSRIPSVSSAMANLVAYVLLEYNHNEILKKEKSIITFLSEQTSKLELELNGLENEYVALQKRYKIYSEEVVKNEFNLIHISNSKGLDEISRELEVNQKLKGRLRHELKNVQSRVGKNNDSSLVYLSQLQKRLDLLNYQNSVKDGRGVASIQERDLVRQKIANIMTRYKSKLSKSKPFLTINPLENIKDIEKRIMEIDSKVFELKSKKNAQLKLIARSENKIKNIPRATRELLGIKRRIELTSNLFKQLAEKLQETRVREAGQVNDLKIVTYAEPSGRPAGMGVKKSYILSGLVGFAVSLMLLLLKFVLIPTIRDASDLEKIGIKVIGTLPFYRSKRKTVFSMGSDPSVILEDESVGYEANLIRKTRFLLQKEINKTKRLYSSDNGATIISVCSANSNEGKTFFSSNLSLSLSKTEQKVLLIDADFMKPDVKDYFKDKKTTDSRKLIFNNFSMRLRTVNEGFDILDAPSSSENIADYLQGKSFKKLVAKLKQEYDIIIFDTPAIDGYLEPMVISQFANIILFIVNQRITLLDDVLTSVKRINDGSTENVLGIINFTYEEYKTNKKFKKAS